MMRNKYIRLASAGVLLIILMLLLFIAGRKKEQKLWYEEYGAICHALGATKEGVTLTNSLEAFINSYELGYRVFEADIQITSDNVMVLRHDWGSDLGQGESFGWSGDDKPVPTEKQFVEAPVCGNYTPLTLENWFHIMKDYPDIYMVTDTKYSNTVEEQFQLFVDTAKACGCEEVLKRVIVQIYYPAMYEEVMAVYPFQNIILTLYYIGYAGGKETAGFCQEKGIPVLVMPYTWWNSGILEELADYDVKVYLHTVDDEDEAASLFEQGADGIYTDNITPEIIKKLKNNQAY